MSQPPLEILSDRLTEAHGRIQHDFQNINPIVGLSRKMRDIGFPSDTLTIDCLKTRRRIILILHDEQPDIVSYQFTGIDKDPDEEFEAIAFNELTTQVIYDWIKSYFSKMD
ncbi:hypothetical protein [Aliikangiella coralliicola]|uniref:Uncharacterized protein n=1 Tax=Aliikangiella coralliicola TaxID=2592383 RepID=A0A545UDR1_9GAMM|nr:hypothetical protein [Aliikangiella coralliicola]TQV87600.1 hypothetical protein FLL46_12070 [Aliikangiella coralliicola]